MPVDRLGVDRGPLAIRAVQQVRHHQVGVQLRVVGPGGAVLERGDDPAVGADPLGALAVALMAAQPVPGDRLQEAHDLGHRGLVGGPDLQRGVRVAQPEQHANRLRRGDGDVDPRSAVVHPTPRELHGFGVGRQCRRPRRRRDRRRSPAARPGPGPRSCPAALARPGHPAARAAKRARSVGSANSASTGTPCVGAGLDRVDKRAGGQPAARIGPQHRRDQLPPVRRRPRQQPAQGVGAGGVEATGQPRGRRTRAEPAAGRLSAQVVVRGAVGLPGQVVAGRVRPRPEHRHRHHHPGSPTRRGTAGQRKPWARARGGRCADRYTGPRTRVPMQSCVPGNLPTSRVAGRNLEQSCDRTAADRDGHRGKGVGDGSRGQATRRGWSARRAGVRSCPPPWSQKLSAKLSVKLSGPALQASSQLARRSVGYRWPCHDTSRAVNHGVRAGERALWSWGRTLPRVVPCAGADRRR